MKRCLIMITTSYPFTSGEPYLEAEMPHLAKRFDQIFLFTIGLSTGVSPTVALPENVVVCNPAKGSSKVSKALDLINGIPCVFKIPKRFESEKQYCGASMVKRLFAGYLISRSKRHCNELYGCLRDFDFSVFDEVVLYGYWFFAATATAALLKEKLALLGAKKMTLFSRAHRYDIYAYANRLNYLPLRPFLFESVDKVLACSENGKNYLTENYPQYAEKIDTAFLGTDGGVLTKGSDDGVLRILTCSRAVPVKRLDRLASALTKLKDSDIKISWTHIGDGESLPELENFAKKNLGFLHSLDFTGFMPHEDVLEKIKKGPFDLFINISESEGLPVSIMEAISFGIPTIVTDVGGCSEIIYDGKNGYLIPSDFSDELLAEKINDFALCDSASVSAMRSCAFEMWQKKFVAENNFESFAQKLQKSDFS